jgi:transposase
MAPSMTNPDKPNGIVGSKNLLHWLEFRLAIEVESAGLAGRSSYKVIAEQMKIRNCTQLKVWVKKWRNGQKFDERKGVVSPLKGRPRISFSSIEEERDYLKAQVHYLKKRYPNLVKEDRSGSKITTS